MLVFYHLTVASRKHVHLEVKNGVALIRLNQADSKVIYNNDYINQILSIIEPFFKDTSEMRLLLF